MKLGLFVLLQLVFLNTYSQEQSSGLIPNRIAEQRFIKINDIEQWVTIKGDSTKPIVLFLHGGPGNPLSPFADAIYSKWERDFNLVQWDQRGAGRTYGRTAPDELTPEYLKSNPLTIDQMTADGIELAEYLVQRFRKPKVILFGTSWGSLLGVKMALKKPELFYAYIGNSQIVDPRAGALVSYQQVVQLAQAAKDHRSLTILDSIGKPPYDMARTTGLFNRVVRKYDQAKATPPPASWFKFAPEYDNEKDNQNRFDSDDYSFVNYCGDKRLEISAMSSTINFFRDGLVFQIPVYFIQGEEDIITPTAMNKQYFSKITAPEKKIILLPKTGHGFNESVIDAQYRIMTQFIVPVIERK